MSLWHRLLELPLDVLDEPPPTPPTPRWVLSVPEPLDEPLDLLEPLTLEREPATYALLEPLLLDEPEPFWLNVPFSVEPLDSPLEPLPPLELDEPCEPLLVVWPPS